MTVHANPNGFSPESHPVLDDLQYRQELHDRIFHLDIYNLAKPERLKHLVLHQVKYIATIYGAAQDLASGNNLLTVKAKCVDGFIVVMSMLNVCNALISDHLRFTVMDVQGCLDEGIRAVGQLSKVVEDIDHMASNSPLSMIRNECLNLTTVYLNLAAHVGVPLDFMPTLALERLVQVEKINVHYGRHEVELQRLLQVVEGANEC